MPVTRFLAIWFDGFSVAHHETRWIPLTSSKAPLNLEISASLDDAGKLQVMVRGQTVLMVEES